MTTETNEAARPSGPPLPKAAYRIVNPIMGFILRSPLHGLLSGSLMMLMFQGRKSGRRYSIPVGYTQIGDRLFVFSHSAWANNFRDGAPVLLRLRGKAIRGTARLSRDQAQFGEVVRKFIEKNGPEMAQRLGLSASAQAIPAGTFFVEIALAEPVS